MDGKTNYFAFVPKISNSSFDALFKTLCDFCKNYSTKENLSEHDIILKKMYCPNENFDINMLEEF